MNFFLPFSFQVAYLFKKNTKINDILPDCVIDIIYEYRNQLCVVETNQIIQNIVIYRELVPVKKCWYVLRPHYRHCKLSGAISAIGYCLKCGEPLVFKKPIFLAMCLFFVSRKHSYTTRCTCGIF